MAFFLSACNQCRDGCVNGVCIKNYCDCDIWYAGDRCDRSELTVYEGAYNGTFSFGTASEVVSFNLVGSPENPSELLCTELGFTLAFKSITRFDVPEHVWKDRPWTGEGEMLLDLISIRLNYSDSTGIQEGLIEAYREE